MHALLITQRQLAKIRTRPLHVHCRNLLEKAGQLVNQETIGAPELMLWTLQNKADELHEEDIRHLQEVVHMIQDKPSLVLSLLEPYGQEQQQEEICSEIQAQEDPQEAGVILLKHLKQRIDRFVES
jgi:phosphopantetheine adenylyltransferase